MLKIFLIFILTTSAVFSNSTTPVADGVTPPTPRWFSRRPYMDPYGLGFGTRSTEKPRQIENNLTTNPTNNFVSIAKCPGSQYSRDEVLIPPHFMVKGHQNDSLTIRLTPEAALACPGGKVVHLSVPLMKDGKQLKDSVSIRFLKDGLLLIANSNYYNTDQYCFSRFNGQQLSLSHCKLTCAPVGSVLCIPKCCPLHQVVKLADNGDRDCVSDGGTNWSPRIYSATNKAVNQIESSSPLALSQTLPLHFKYTRLVGDLIPFTNRPISLTAEDEDGGTFVESLEPTPFRLLDDGSLMTLIPEEELNRECGDVVQRLPIYKQFCIDGLMTGDETVFTGSEENQIVYLPSILEDESKINTVIKAVVIIIGVVFLVLTLIMYIIIWPKHNIHGWTVFSFVVSMLLFFVTLAVVQITHITADLDVLNTRPCLTVAILGHFTFLCALSWMSVMNFNFWATFRNMSVSQERHKSVTRYLAYFIFAVGLPTLIVGISLILHFSHDLEVNHHGLLPGYGTVKCQLHPCSQRYYLYIPMSCLLGFNLVCFSWTIFSLWTYKQKAAQAGSGGNRQNQSWILFCKLFLVMGITWIFECLSGFLHWDFIYFDVINLLQAVAIFFIFTAKRDNLLWIYKRYPGSKKFIRPILHWKPCYVAELDGADQTEMTSAEKNRITLMSLNKTRISSGSDN